MELLSCPGCGGFVRRSWTACRSCGDELAEVVDSRPDPMVDETPDPGNVPEPDAPQPPETDTPEPDAPNPVPSTETEAPTPADGTVVGESQIVSSAQISTADDAVSHQAESALLPSKLVIIATSAFVLLAVSLITFATLETSDDQNVTREVSQTTAAIGGDWVQHSGDGFQIAVPTPPDIKTETIDTRASTLVQSDTADQRARLTLRVTGGGWGREDQVLTDALGRYASTFGFAIESSKIARDGDRRLLTASLAGGQKRTSFRCWISDERLYEMAVTMNDGSVDPDLFTRFADSLTTASSPS